MIRRFIVVVAAVGQLAACGGTSISDIDGSGGASGGGAGGAGAVSGAGGAVGGSGGGTSECPQSFPSHGAACSPSGMSCIYDQGACCPPSQAACVDGTWQAYQSSCASPPQPVCPDQPPIDGTSCGTGDPCGSAYQYCTYGTCSGGSPATVAECYGKTWKVSQAKCSPACESLGACDCFARSDCQAITGDCFCLCEYECPGSMPCDCYCGGGPFYGCKSFDGGG